MRVDLCGGGPNTGMPAPIACITSSMPQHAKADVNSHDDDNGGNGARISTASNSVKGPKGAMTRVKSIGVAMANSSPAAQR